MRQNDAFKNSRKYKLLFFIVVLLTCLGKESKAQTNKYIFGTIKDSSGKPLQDISIIIKGEKIKEVISKEDGTFTIPISNSLSKYQLSFLGAGFKTKYLDLSQLPNDSLHISMINENSSLNEVVVTGTSAGTTRKQLGSYVATVKAEDLTKGASGNILASLQGKTAGAQISQNSGDPAGGISVKLRGVSSVNGSTEPLYIVDGIIIDNSTTRVTNTGSGYDGTATVGNIGQSRIADINPDDIERVEVLNGAAAAAIYGSRANAGVVQIFTKRGSKGAPIVSFSTNLASNSIRKKLDVNEAKVKFGGDPELSTQTILTPTITNTTAVNRYDYQDYVFRTGVGSDNNLSVSGGKDKTKYYTSASYYTNNGIIRNTNFNRFSFRLNLDQELNDWVSFNAALNYIYSKTIEKPDGNSFFSPMNSVTILGNYYDIWQRDALGNLQAVGERGRVNPVSVIEDIQQQQQVSRILAGAGIKLKPIKNLLIDYHMGIDNYSQNGTTYIPPFAYNVSTAFYGGGTTLDPTLNGYASTATNINFQINHDINATYNAKISDKISSVTQLGYSLQYMKSNYHLNQGRGLPPFVKTVDGASTILPGSATFPLDQRTEMSIWGEFLQQNFKYNNQLFLTGALRVDGSSAFGSNQRNQLYKKLSLSYIISEADFWKKSAVSSWWNLLKLRSAYGESGNLTGIGAYERYNNYASANFIGFTSFQSSSKLANSNVKPERQKELEIGTDMAFLDNRIGLTFNYYRKRVNDLLINMEIAPSTGYSSLLNNVGSLQNNGFEIVLNATPVKSKNFTWDITAIYNRNKNKAVNIGQSMILLSNNGGAPVAIIQGQPIGVFYGTFFATDANGNQIKDAYGIPLTERGVQNSALDYTTQRDADGLPTGTALQKVIGNPNPKYTATLTNDFTYKRLSLHLQFDAVQGVDVFNADFRTRQGVDNGKVAEQEDLGELPRGYIAGVYNIQQWRIDDGSFVKLREAALNYNFGNLKFFKDFSVSFSGRNLISWDKYKGYDPEVNAAGQSTVMRGIDFGSVPIPKTFTIGIRTKF